MAVKLKPTTHIKLGDIVTLDMIEPYESAAVRKVAKYIYDNLYPECSNNFEQDSLEHAREIVKLVHEAEDSDE